MITLITRLIVLAVLSFPVYAIESLKTVTKFDLYLADTSGADITTATFTDITVYWRCFGGTTTAIDESGDTLTNVGDGYYEVVTNDTITCAAGNTLSAWATGTVGGNTVDVRHRQIQIVANIESDTYSRLGAPAGASIAADIAALGGSATVLADTTIATLASQTSFTLTAGSADDNAYNAHIAVITDSATSTQKAVARIKDYVGATKTVTLEKDPAIFTMAVGDSIAIVATDLNWKATQVDNRDADSQGRKLTDIRR